MPKKPSRPKRKTRGRKTGRATRDSARPPRRKTGRKAQSPKAVTPRKPTGPKRKTRGRETLRAPQRGVITPQRAPSRKIELPRVVGYFVRAGDRNSDEVLSSLRKGFEAAGAELGLRIELVDYTSARADRHFVEEVHSALESAHFVVVNLSPDRRKSGANGGAHNGSVYYEYGVARERGIKILPILDVSEGRTKVESDIEPAVRREYSKHSELEAFARNWFLTEREEIHSHALIVEARKRVRQIEERARHLIVSHGSAAACHFAGMVDNLEEDLSRLASFYQKGTTGRQRPTRWRLMEQMYCEKLWGLRAQDTYRTVTVLPFWAAFDSNGQRFLEAHEAALSAGAKVYRVFGLPRHPSELRLHDREILKAHVGLARKFANYVVKYFIDVDLSAHPNSSRHFGIVTSGGKSAAFHPSYDGPTHRLIDATYVSDVGACESEFRRAWKMAKKLRTKDLVDRRAPESQRATK